ncbi:toxin [Streptomyces olivaceus]|uniref:toxin n=1 Tax=Streptomyces TaxID=1883 RepID=UPI0014137A28|nr:MULTISPECIES: toxin [Streptomyces]MBZ6195348.1 toxin [Streptomyces olivaceus]MBZ6202025.1 toxin [Streptomyces olivaceus]MBZ6284799.1 toxin [Streptomyces olivaceus]MBZ6292446.1 toxin [Streptomyces olivaceus]MBZ6306512.1 toxin [Streptomyces olivaceus]
MGTRKEMRRLADALIDPIRVPVPADPEVLFEALVASVGAWRGREVLVHRAAFPPHTASGLWLERESHDDVVVDERAAVWHQIVILCHEVWHMSRRAEAGTGAGADARPVAARTDFSLAEEQEADRFGMLMGSRLRPWLDASADSVFAAGDGDRENPSDLAGRIGAALNYRGTTR